MHPHRDVDLVAAEEAEFTENLKVKEELLTQAEALTIDEEHLEATKAELRRIQDRWEAAGKVPRADIRRGPRPVGALEANLAAPAPAADEPLKLKSRFLLRAMNEGRPFPPTYPCPVHVVRFGTQLVLVALGGELVVDYAHLIKRELSDRAPLAWVAGYCNDMFGYVPTRAVLSEGGYEGERSVLWSALPMPFTADAEDRVMNAVRELLGKVGL